MKILFVNMPIRGHDKPNNIPLGIYYLKAILQRDMPGCKVEVVDLNIYRPFPSKALTESLLAEHADADVFMLSGLVTTYSWQKDVAYTLKKMCPDRSIVSGGGLASNVGELLLEHTCIDSVAIGQGDHIVSKIAADAAAGRLQKVYREEPVPELDAVPWPAWESVEGIETYIGNPIWGGESRNSSWAPFAMKRSLSLISSRGCPFQCRFCNKDITGGRNYRGRSAEDIVKEVKYLKETFDLDFIGFVDDNLAISKTRLLEICDGMKALDIRWGCHARFDNVDHPSLLFRMREAGCVYIGFGGESANRDILHAMKKRNDPDQMKKVIRRCRQVGIHPNVTWMMGWPGETREQIRETAQFILEHAPENRRMFVATAYPHTELYEEVKEKIYQKYSDVMSYVSALGDANKPLVNFTAMSDEEFMEVYELVSNGKLREV